ncbi:hypothetical protein BIY24_07640 [Halobacteriovorax marinus]|uniref:tandem-95 repeat protein n=1 Tax=Halobacteriovorax marinus TaxID=97084 RepID=UPI000BC307F5|nr:Ig-like domain-containing protein [Halobacteriovorax marinus]ATH07825.1 hypothetical protein BIY24_07640 [Halobacteriovorax marinus]
MLKSKIIISFASLAIIIASSVVIKNELTSKSNREEKEVVRKFKKNYKLIKRSTASVKDTTTNKFKKTISSSSRSEKESATPTPLLKSKKKSSKKKPSLNKALATANKIESIIENDSGAIYMPDDSFSLVEGSEKKRNESTKVFGISTTSDSSTNKEAAPTTSVKKAAATSGSKSTPTIIKGRIPALLGSITHHQRNNLINTAYAAACVNPKIELFDINTMTVIADNPINQEDLKADTEFSFDPFALNLEVEVPTRYILRTSGCPTNYQRIVTSFKDEQNLGPATTLISSILRTSIEIDIEKIDSNLLHAATTELELNTAPDYTEEQVYTKLKDSLALKAKFQESFEGNGPEHLLNAAPEVLSIDVQESIKEKSNYTFTINTKHWSSDYTTAYEWHLNGALVANTASWTFTPSANSIDEYNIVLKVGKKNDGDLNINTSNPYHQLEYTIPVEDLFSVTAPSFALNAANTNPTNTLNIALDINTGAETSPSIYANCETFENLAITEDNNYPADGDFNISCTSENTQVLNYTIQKATDGDVDLNIWARDINGKISSASILTLEVDRSSPTMAFNSLATNYRADRTINIKWDVTEKNNDGTQNFIVDFFDGSSWSNIGSVSSVSGAINNQTFDMDYALPNILVNNARFRVTFEDSLSNQTILESGDISVNKPVLAISPSSHNYSDTLNLSNGTTHTFTVSNSGQASADQCTNAILSGANAAEFELVSDNCGVNDLAVSSNCTIEVRPKPNTKGAKSSTLSWSCGSDVVSTNLNFNSINNSPTAAANSSHSTNEDNLLNFNVTAGSDIDSDPITYSIVSAPSNGVLANCLQNDTDLNCDYTPSSNYYGSDSFTYRVNDGSSNSTTTTVTLTINSVNDAPVIGSNESFNTNEDTAVNFTFNAATDVDIPAQTLSYKVITPPSNGVLSGCIDTTNWIADRDCAYTPNANFNGSDSFTYRAYDSETNSVSDATVTLNIAAINDAPVLASGQVETVNEDTTLNFTLNAATDIDLDTLSYSVVSTTTSGVLSCGGAEGRTCTYNPNTNFNGSDSFTYKANDSTADSNTVSVNITINPINDAPTLTATQTVSTQEDNVLNFSLNAGSDVDGDTLNYIIISNPVAGTLNCVEGTSRACTYTPDNNDNGTETFTYKVNDGNADSPSATVTINISAENDPPVVANAQSFTTNEDTAINFTIDDATDIDIPSQTISYKLITPPSNGTLTNCITATYSTDLTCTYTPNSNFNGSDSFTYRANDGVTDSSSDQTISFTINPVNDAPTLAATSSVSTNEDTVLNFNLTAGSDVESSPLSYIIVSNPSDGTLSCSGGTSTACTYTPAPNQNGTRTFTYKVNDGELDSTTSTVTITINAVNDAPVMLADQSFTTNEDILYSVTLNGATDQETATGSLTYKITTQPTNGVLANCIDNVSWNGDIICDYTPNSNFNGSDSFSYKAYDGALESATTSTVSITINAVNDAPTLAATQSEATNEDTALNFNLDMGSDVDGDTLSYIIVSSTSNGTLTCSGGTARDCSYTPNANYHGSDSFTYKVNDGALDSTTNTVTITINAVNDAPTLAATQSESTNEDTVLNFNLNAGSDLEGDTLNYIIVSSTTDGILNCTEGTSRSCTYTPNLNFNGSDSFTYKVNDGQYDSTISTVTITVAPVNDAPVKANDQSIATNEDTAHGFTLNAGSDVDGDALTYIIVANPSNGLLSCTDRSCTYTPNANYNGADSFTYKVNDSALDSVANTTVSITVNSVNDRPVMASDQVFSTDDNVTLSLTLSNATDIDGDTLGYKIITSPSNGTLSNCITSGAYSSDLTCDYNANANFNGTDSFTFIANDGTIDAATTQTVTINVSDKTPPAAPALNLASALYTNSTATAFTATSCTDTPDFLFNEGTRPASGDANWQSCNTSAASMAYTLANTNQGVHTIKAWSKDVYGNVSLTSNDIDVTYDTVLPSIATTDPVALKGGASNTLNWTTTELNSSTSLNYTISFYNGSTWSTLGTVASSNGPLSSAPFNYSWTTPSLDITNAKFKVDFTDLAGNSRSVSSVDFEVDSTAPSVAITSPANGSYHTSSATIDGTCEDGINVNFSGDIQTSFDIACSSGTFSQLVNFSNGDGNKVINVSQTDTAGNITQVTRTLIRDEVAPTLTKTGGTSPDFTKNNTPNQWSGTCEGTYTISVTGDETTSFPCSTGSWSWTPSPKTVDGSYSYSLVQTDGAGNTSTSLSLSWDRDATPPPFTATSPYTANAGDTITETTNHDSLTFSGTCEGTNSIVISGDASGTIGCSSTNWNWTTPTYSTDGLRNFTLTQSDPAGNTSVINIAWTRDTTGPALSIASNTFKTNGDSVTFEGSCEAGLTIDITGAETTTTSCASGTWSWVTTNETTDAERVYNFGQTNAVNNTTTVIGTWHRETDAPTISALSSTAPNPTKNPNIPMSMTATSQNANVGISHICIKSNDTTAPLVDDNCWIAVNDPSIGLAVSQNLNLSGNYYHLLGWNTNISIPVYAWVQDEATNISTLSNSGNGTDTQDKISRVYDPGVPPAVADVIAANAPNTPNPPTRAQSAVPAGSDVYIRYKITDNSALPSGAVQIYYTPNEIDFTLISGAESLDAGTNYGCTGYTLEANEGCFKWTGGSPLNDSYKVRVKVTDDTALSAQSISNPLNSDTIKIIAGNTESGLGGSAISAMFFTRKSGSESDPGTLVVTENGTIYFADYKRGILVVDPEDGKQKIFIRQTGTSTGDGGAATNATLRFATKIALDFQNRLLILDTNRIRRVDLNQATPTIETIIGGGSDTGDTVTNPLDLSIYTHSTNSWSARNIPFFAAPNGDIYFMSDYGIKNWNAANYRLRIYKAATGQVTSKYVTGTGDALNASQNILECRISHFGLAYNPTTSALTGVDIQTYHEDSYGTCNDYNDRYTRAFLDPETFVARNDLYSDSYRYYRYFKVTGMDGNSYQIIDRNYVMRNNWDGTYTKVLGSGTRGNCADGTTATSCNMDIQDIFVTATGKIYFTDAGQIRTVDSNGKVVTLFGQHPAYGDNVNALNARFSYIDTVARLDNGKIITADPRSYYFKEFTVEGNINILAGNGNYGYQNFTTDPKLQPFYNGSYWVVDKATGDIMVRRGSNGDIVRLNRSNNLWERIIGSGSTNFWDGDGVAGLSIHGSTSGNQSHALPIGYGDGKVLTMRMRYYSPDLHWQDFALKAYDATNNFTQSHVAGTNGTETYTGGYSGICSSGSPAATCKMPYYDSWGSNAWWDAANGRWILAGRYRVERHIWSITPGGNAVKLAQTARNIDESALWINESGTDMLYYCYGGKIYKHNITTNSDLNVMSWPISNLSCRGLKMDYNPTNNSIIFPFEQNGLYGIAEYFLP